MEPFYYWVAISMILQIAVCKFLIPKKYYLVTSIVLVVTGVSAIFFDYSEVFEAFCFASIGVGVGLTNYRRAN